VALTTSRTTTHHTRSGQPVLGTAHPQANPGALLAIAERASARPGSNPNIVGNAGVLPGRPGRGAAGRLVQSRGRPQRAPDGQDDRRTGDVRALHRERIDAQPGMVEQNRVRAEYDSWGGWYDQVPPPSVDRYGYGSEFRPAGRPYARTGGRSTTHARTSHRSCAHRAQNWHSPAGERDARAQANREGLRFLEPPPRTRVRPDEAPARRGRGGDTRVSLSWGIRAPPSARPRVRRAALASTRPPTGVIAGPPPGRQASRARGANAAWERWPLEPEEGGVGLSSRNGDMGGGAGLAVASRRQRRTWQRTPRAAGIGVACLRQW